MTDERHFCATLERGDRALGWTIVRLPFAPRSAWPLMRRLRVAGTLTGPAGVAPFRTSLFAFPGEVVPAGFFVLVNRTMQKGAGLALGMTGEFSLHPDLEDRPADLPEGLDMLLDEAEGLRAWYNQLSESTRRELAKWIAGVRSDEARLRRTQQTAERLLNAMESEIELPPALAQAFAARSLALHGWRQMTPRQRRGELLAVFFYQSPEARYKRIARLLDTAERHAGTRRPVTE